MPNRPFLALSWAWILSTSFAASPSLAAHPGGAEARPVTEFLGDGVRRTPAPSAGARARSVEMHLARIGRDDALAAPPSPEAPASRGDRVEYRRGAALTEWYVDAPSGLEQGFTLDAPPGGEGRLVLEVAFAPGVAPRPSADGTGADLYTRAGARLGRYADLWAKDATGRPLAAALTVADGAVRLVVEDRGAAYPVVIDPILDVVTEISAPDATANAFFGSAVAVSGTTAIVGATGAGNSVGATYAFLLGGGTWSQQQRMQAADPGANDGFGVAIAISGNIAIIGAPAKNGGVGAAYVFVRSGATWSQQQKLLASDGLAGDAFGLAVAVNGTTAAVGAPEKNGQAGAAYVYTQSGATWSLQQKLAPADGAAGDEFGNSLGVSGTTLVAGARSRAGSAGAAYVYTRSGTTWSVQQELGAPDGTAGDLFGASVAIDGDTVVAGAPNRNGVTGVAYVFARSGTVWSDPQEIAPVDGTSGESFGSSVGVSGTTLVVGAPGRALGTGAAYMYSRGLVTWTPQQELEAIDGAEGDLFGLSVALDGSTFFTGAENKSTATLASAGAAYAVSALPPAAPALGGKAADLGALLLLLGVFASARAARRPSRRRGLVLGGI